LPDIFGRNTVNCRQVGGAVVANCLPNIVLAAIQSTVGKWVALKQAGLFQISLPAELGQVGGAESGWSLHNIVAGTGGPGQVGGAESGWYLHNIVAGTFSPCWYSR
jgi:hypothetical protein